MESLTESTVANIMSTDIISVAPTTPIPEVARLMVEHHVSGIPVIDNGDLVGIVTESDVVSREIDVDAPAFATFLDAIFILPWDRHDDEFKRVLATTVSGLMSAPVQTINGSASIHEVADLMFKHHVNPVPVVDDAGQMVGIVSRSDVLRLIAEAG
jgi:CBS domain-containing protein